MHICENKCTNYKVYDFEQTHINTHTVTIQNNDMIIACNRSIILIMVVNVTSTRALPGYVKCQLLNFT